MLIPLAFFRETLGELKKVIWPTKDEVIRLTGVVLIVSIIVGLYVGGLDFIFTKILALFLK